MATAAFHGSSFQSIIVAFLLVLLADSLDSRSGGDYHIPKSSINRNFLSDMFFEIIEPESLNYLYRFRNARNFGVEFPNKDRAWKAVRLVPTVPEDGCSELVGSVRVYGAVALIRRGGCSFVEKTIQAERSGAVAVLIYDNDADNTDYMIDMVDDETQRSTSIPAGFLLGADGHAIRSSLRRQKLAYAIVDIPLNQTTISSMYYRRPPWSNW